MPSESRQHFIDWMKATGMLLILIGHVIGDPANLFNQLALPGFTKQIGVAFFVFVTGWGLANNTRPPLRTVFNRLFPFYFYGVLFAIILSLTFLVYKNDTNPSNYLPFALGVNVFLNYFPANPTTWYIGTYIHLLLFWYFFLAGKKIGPGHLALALVVEVLVRALILSWGRDFTAYMILPSWMTTFLLGMYLHQRGQLSFAPETFFHFGLLAAFATVWTLLMLRLELNDSFPIRHLPESSFWTYSFESLMLSVVYLSYTYLFFETARRLGGNSLVRFFAQATLITVILHMPIVFEAHGLFYAQFEDEMVARIFFIATLFVGLAILSALLDKLVNIVHIREWVWTKLNDHLNKPTNGSNQ
jgi:hypothetical protein